MIEDISLHQVDIEFINLKEKYAELLIENDYMQQYYEAMVDGCLFSYKVNATNDTILIVPELFRATVKKGDSYNDFLKKNFSNMITEAESELVYDTVCSEAMLNAYNSGERQIAIDYLSQSLTPDVSWYRNHIYLIQHPVSGDIHAIVTIKNIQQQKIREMTLLKKAQLDSLTQLFNRNYLEEQVAIAVANDLDGYCAILMDIDNFKHINDNYGHQIGDKVLISFAKMLKSKFRQEDVVSRLGGDEFFVFMKNGNPDIIKTRVQSIVDACKTLMQDSNIKVSTSIGISIYPNFGKNFKELYKNADTALYHTKQNGKNGYTIYHTELENDYE